MTWLTITEYLFVVVITLSFFHWILNKSSTTCATGETGTAYNSKAPGFIPYFYWGLYCSIFSFLWNVLMIIFYIFVLLLAVLFYCPSFLDLPLLITPLVSPYLSLICPSIFSEKTFEQAYKVQHPIDSKSSHNHLVHSCEVRINNYLDHNIMHTLDIHLYTNILES